MDQDPVRTALLKAKDALWGGNDLPGALVAVNAALSHLDDLAAIEEALNENGEFSFEISGPDIPPAQESDEK